MPSDALLWWPARPLAGSAEASGHAELQQLWSCRDLVADLPCDLGTRASAASLAVPAEAR